MAGLSAILVVFGRKIPSTPNENCLQDLMDFFLGQLFREVELASENRLALPNTSNAELIKSVLNYMGKNLHRRLACPEMAAMAGLSESHFAVTFKKMTGRSPYQYHLELKLKKAQQLLMTSKMPVAIIAAELGFSSQAHFAKAMRNYCGATPLEVRKGG